MDFKLIDIETNEVIMSGKSITNSEMSNMINGLNTLNEKYMELEHEKALIQDKFWGMFDTPEKLYKTYLIYLGDEYRVDYVSFDNLAVYLELQGTDNEIVTTVDFNEFNDIWLENGLVITE